VENSSQEARLNKVTEAIINGNNVQKMKVSSQPQGSVCVCVCGCVCGVCVFVCFECPISVELGICVTSITNVCVFYRFATSLSLLLSDVRSISLLLSLSLAAVLPAMDSDSDTSDKFSPECFRIVRHRPIPSKKP
jgi:hypothetical protein